MTAPSESKRTPGSLRIHNGLVAGEVIDESQASNGLVAISEHLTAVEDHYKKLKLAYTIGGQMTKLIYDYGQPDYQPVSWKYGVREFIEGEHRIPSVRIPTESGDVEVWLSAIFYDPNEVGRPFTVVRDQFIHFKLRGLETTYGIKDRTPSEKRSFYATMEYDDLPSLKELKTLEKVMPTVIEAYEKSDFWKTPEMPDPDHP